MEVEISSPPEENEMVTPGIGVVKQLEEPRQISDQKRPRPQKEQALNCPRCNSTNTKFCYYNNYSLTQPRYFCKTCRRYWTEGGTLRTVPVGGGSRKNKRSSSSISSQTPSSSSKKLLDHATSASVSHSATQNPMAYEGQDLNLGYSPITSYDQYNKTMELLKNGSIPTMGLNSLMLPMAGSGSNPLFPPEFPLQEYKPTLNFSLNGIDQNGYANLQSVQETTPRLFFPFNDLKQAPNPNDELEQNRRQGEANGYWSGMLNEGSW